MSLRFFIAQCVPNSIIELLRNANYEILILKNYIPINLDSLIITKVQELNAILIPT